MKLVVANSLAKTLDAVNAARFFQQDLSAKDRQAAAQFILRRFDLPRAYARTFALFPHETTIRLFTGETAGHASARHIAAEEACRALLFLNVRGTQSVLAQASASLLECIGPVTWKIRPLGHNADVRPYLGGTYCCAPCSVGFWRHLTAGGLDQQDARLARGLKCLKAMRQSDGTWRAFPFWYTLSALLEMPPDRARPELRHAAARCEKSLTRQTKAPYHQRRAELARRLLSQI
jgi:hypothetical protein